MAKGKINASQFDEFEVENKKEQVKENKFIIKRTVLPDYRMTLRLGAQEKYMLDILSWGKNTSVSAEIRNAIDDYIEKNNEKIKTYCKDYNKYNKKNIEK